MIARYEQVLRRTARRYSLCADDAEDAYQRMLEILLTKAPTDGGQELIAWAQTVTKHEALAIRRNRERLLGAPVHTAPGHSLDVVALIPATGAGPEESAERREAIARSREALQALKPAELRALTLLAAGYSYAEIGELTGFSHTKVNRCLAEGRERFRALLSRGEDGSRCAEMQPLLSAFCDGEASGAQEAALREHLRACAGCRSVLRAYRATPRAVAALAPGLPLWRSLLDRAQAILSDLHSRLPGHGVADSAAAQVAAAGGAPGAGVAGLAKVVAVCLGTAGGAAACVATGVAPLPLGLAPDHAKPPAIERTARQAGEAPAPAPAGAGYEAAAPPAAQPKPKEKPAGPEPAAGGAEAGAVEYAPPPASPAPAAEPARRSSGSAAGEFGP